MHYKVYALLIKINITNINNQIEAQVKRVKTHIKLSVMKRLVYNTLTKTLYLTSISHRVERYQNCVLNELKTFSQTTVYSLLSQRNGVAKVSE